MIILGLDPAQTTGYAYYDPSRPLSAIEAGVIKCGGSKSDPIEERIGRLGRELMLMLRARRPDFIAIEEPGRRQFEVETEDSTKDLVGGGGSPRLTGLASIISSNQIVGGYAMICAVKDIPFTTIPVATWRKHFLGFARRPGFSRKQWKEASREKCAQLRITVTNDDMADAVGVAFAAAASDAFRLLSYERSRAA